MNMNSDNPPIPTDSPELNKFGRYFNKTAVIIILLVVLITIAHYFLQTVHIILHNFLQRMYYVPIVLAAYHYETKGAVKTALFSGLLYLPHVLITWQGHYAYQASQFLEIIIFVVVGYLSGVLFDQKNNAAEMLQKYQKMAQFGELSRSVIRSLKSPIKSIRGMLVIIDDPAATEGAIRPAVEVITKQVETIEQIRTDLISLVSRKHLRLKKQDLNQIVSKFQRQIEEQLFSRRIMLCRALATGRLEAMINSDAIIETLHNLISWQLKGRRLVDKITVFTGGTHRQIWAGITVDNITLPTIYQGTLEYLPNRQEAPAQILHVLNVMNNHFGDVKFRMKEGHLQEFILVLPKNIKLPRHLRDSSTNSH